MHYDNKTKQIKESNTFLVIMFCLRNNDFHFISVVIDEQQQQMHKQLTCCTNKVVNNRLLT